MSKILAKLFADSLPVTVDRNKFRIADAKAEIAAIERKRGGRKLTLLSKLNARRVNAIKRKIKKLAESPAIDAVLTPLTEQDTWTVQMHCQTMREVLQSDIPPNLPKDTADKYDRAMIDQIGMQGMIRGVECALKKPDKVDGKWVRMYTHKEIVELVKYDVRVILDLWREYITKLELTGEELGESSRPVVN